MGNSEGQEEGWGANKGEGEVDFIILKFNYYLLCVSQNYQKKIENK